MANLVDEEPRSCFEHYFLYSTNNGLGRRRKTSFETLPLNHMSFTNNLNVLNQFVLLCLTYCAAVFLSDLYLTSLSDSADGTKLIFLTFLNKLIETFWLTLTLQVLICSFCHVVGISTISTLYVPTHMPTSFTLISDSGRPLC